MQHLRPLRIALAWAAVAAVLLGVFTLYTRPEFLIAMADRIWSCF